MFVASVGAIEGRGVPPVCGTVVPLAPVPMAVVGVVVVGSGTVVVVLGSGGVGIGVHGCVCIAKNCKVLYMSTLSTNRPNGRTPQLST